MELPYGDGGDDSGDQPVNPYPPVTLAPDDVSLITNSLRYGANSYTYIAEQRDAPASSDCRSQIIKALQLRCQTDQQLINRKFILPTQPASERAQVKLQIGINLSDFIPSPPPDPARPSRRAAIVIDCEMVGVEVSSSSSSSISSGGHLYPSRLPRNLPRPPPPPPQTLLPTTTTTSQPRPTKKAPHRPFERSELVQLCAVDAVTGEILIDALVQPAGRVVNWRTRYSGCTPARLRAAAVRAQAPTQGGTGTGTGTGTGVPFFQHWRYARERLLEYVDADTVLVGHSVENDLHVLRLAHGRVVDTSMQTAAAVFDDGGSICVNGDNNSNNSSRIHSFPRIWGLKQLALRLTGKTIQTGGGGGGAGAGAGGRPGRHRRATGHDCVEDTLATRELALWCILHPAGLAAWGGEMRKEMAAKEAALREKRREEEKKRAEAEEEEAAERAATTTTTTTASTARAEQQQEKQQGQQAFDEKWPPLEPRPVPPHLQLYFRRR